MKFASILILILFLSAPTFAIEHPTQSSILQNFVQIQSVEGQDTVELPEIQDKKVIETKGQGVFNSVYVPFNYNHLYRPEYIQDFGSYGTTVYGYYGPQYIRMSY